ncbi:MAG: MBOAT family protein [Alphaproteobacteria bacterium]|nr:MBOAT family protein [Alphaproteobacteria bacterium]
MVFSSAIFLSLFLPISLGLYFLAQEKLRNYVLLAASLFFYAWGEPKAALVMCGLILLTYVLALGIDRTQGLTKKALFTIGVLLNLSALFAYKYWMFFLNNVNLVLENLNFAPVSVPQIALPIGISFYVFQIISYLADVYKGEVKAQSNLSALATYVSLFPQLVAGPIVRYQTIEEDLHNRTTNLDNVFIGLRRFIIGLAKKVLIADQMAFIADTVFNSSLNQLPCLMAWIGIIAYTLQIFYDFSGYSDMAIGLGRIFNFRFLENFNYPYCSQSIKEFWRRWHISLSSWFRDYLYIPLGGNRKGKLRTYLNMYIVFGLCGWWHGATWNFVVWGLYHGTGLVAERLALGKLLEKIGQIPGGKVLLNVYTLLFVIIGWVFFRADDLPSALQFLHIMFCGNADAPLSSFYNAAKLITYSNMFSALAGILCSYPIFTAKYDKFRYSKIETLLVFLLFVITYVFAMTSTFSPFIYFRF